MKPETLTGLKHTGMFSIKPQNVLLLYQSGVFRADYIHINPNLF